MKMRCYILFLALLMLTACDVALKQPEVQKLDVVMLGTYGYTTFEEAGRTIEDYNPNIEYDSSKLPDTQAGFKMTLPIAFYNQGEQAWYDALATLQVMIIAPDGEESVMTLPFKDALVQRRRTEIGGQYLVKEAADAFARRLAADDRRVFYFETSYVPQKAGVYSIQVELRSEGLTGMRLSKSAFSVSVSEATAGITVLPKTCSLTSACSASETCCSKGIDVPLEERQGHCAPSCQPDEIELPYAIRE